VSIPSFQTRFVTQAYFAFDHVCRGQRNMHGLGNTHGPNPLVAPENTDLRPRRWNRPRPEIHHDKTQIRIH